MATPTSPTTDYSLPSIIPRAALEQMIVNQTIADAAFRAQLIADPAAALEQFLGRPLPAGLTVRVYVEDANTFYYVTPYTDPEQAHFSTETGVAPTVLSMRAIFNGRLNYLLSQPDNPPIGDLQSAFQTMQSADTQAEIDTTSAQTAELQAAQAGQAQQAAQLACDEALAADTLVPGPSNDQAVADAQAALTLAQQAYTDATNHAITLRNTAVKSQQNALTADAQYEDVLRATFQGQFAQNPVMALNQFLNLVTPFTSSATILDTDPVDEENPVSPTTGMCFTHLIETTGQVMFIVLPYTTNHTLFMGPYSVSFDGTSSYIQIPMSASLSAHTLLVVEAWVWSDDFRDGYSDVVVSTLANSGGWQLEVGGGLPMFTATLNVNGSTQIISASGNVALPTRQWQYLTGILNEGKLSLYVNGSRVAQADASGELVTGGDLLMGRNAAMQADQSFFQGMIHSVRLWGDAITREVILNNIPVLPGATNFPTPLQQALLADYTFEEGVNFNAIDDSPNHNDGLMVNAIWKITGQDSPAQY